MNFEKWTEKAQNAMMESQNIAVANGHQQLDGEHLHLALLTQEDGLISRLLHGGQRRRGSYRCAGRTRQTAKDTGRRRFAVCQPPDDAASGRGGEDYRAV